MFDSDDIELNILTQQALEIIFHTFVILLERQGADQLPGRKYWQPSEQLKKQAANVPTTNVVSERDFAVFHMLIRMKPAALVMTHETLIMWIHNKTSKWLDQLSENDKEHMMKDAKANVKKLKEQHKERQQRVYVSMKRNF